jgi:hypothetical protein
MSSRMRIAAVMVPLAAVAAVTATAWASVPDTPVRAGRAHEVLPSADGDAGYLAWTQNSAARPKHYDAFVSLSGAPKVMVNATGTSGYNGGIDGTTLVYQQVRRGQSDLHLFDLATHQRSIPAVVNTPQWEWRPSISGPWLLFGRENLRTRPVKSRVLLYNTDTSQLITLVDTPGFSQPGQVNGDFAVYTHCGRVTCNVFRYQISTGQRVKMPNALSRRVQYAPSVSADGTVYYASSRFTCGKDVRIRRFVAGDATASLMTILPAGRDINTTYADDMTDGTTRVLHDRASCKGSSDDIYQVVDP